MARIDDYAAAKDLAVAKLSAESFTAIAQRSGFATPAADTFEIPFLTRVYRVHFPDFDFRDAGDPAKEVPIQEQVLILHYMAGQPGSLPAGKWVAYREIPGAAFYFSAFAKRAIEPLKKVFGADAAGLAQASRQLKAQAVEPGDAAFEFNVFPRVAVRLILWEGDPEFPPEANVLFHEDVGNILSTEDIAWLAGMLVYRLIALSKS